MENSETGIKVEAIPAPDRIDKPTYFIRLLFFLYFTVLTGERLYSLIASGIAGVGFFDAGFNGYVYTAAILSIAAAYAYLIYAVPNFFLCPFTFSRRVHDKIDMRALCVAAGIILVSGMVHTEYTVSGVQFGAYGALIVAMIIRTALAAKSSKSRVLLWLSLAYLTAFSMAIPVMYPSTVELSTLFYIFEAAAGLALIACFTFMLIKMFAGEGENLFMPVPIAIAAVLDAVVIGLNFAVEINYFVLIFICVSVVLWIVGFVFSRVGGKVSADAAE